MPAAHPSRVARSASVKAFVSSSGTSADHQYFLYSRSEKSPGAHCANLTAENASYR
jgi:hypothetical protein